MIDHTGFNVSDYALSRAFYQKALAPLGYRICLELESSAASARSGRERRPRRRLLIGAGEPQAPRMHVAFHAANEEEVNEFYRCDRSRWEGQRSAGRAPALPPGYYAAFVLDPMATTSRPCITAPQREYRGRTSFPNSGRKTASSW